MPTSSIFANIEIRDPEKVEMFINALEKAEESSFTTPATSTHANILRDPDDIRKLLQRWESKDSVYKTVNAENDVPNAETARAIQEVKRMRTDYSIGKAYSDVDQMMKELLTDT